MKQLTQLERVQQVCADFVPNDPPGEHYVYVYLGIAIQDSTPYTFLEDGWYAERCNWHVEWTLDGSVCYVGRGNNGRMNSSNGHPVFPDAPFRLKIKSALSNNDVNRLEALLISELGHLLDESLSTGCLINIRRGYYGEHCCPLAPAQVKRLSLGQTAVDICCMTGDKEVVARGSSKGLSRLTGVDNSALYQCLKGTTSAAYSPVFCKYVCFCYASDLSTYRPRYVHNMHLTTRRMLITIRYSDGEIIAGTSAAVAWRFPEIKESGHLHRVARGEAKSCYGWTARYADVELADEPVSIPYSFF